MPTKAELKTIINDNIRVKTAAGSITKINHASIADAALDYTDQEIQTLVTDINGKQETLVSGTNIKTINGTTILGSGDIVISSGTSKTVGTVSAGTVFPYPQTTFDITLANTVALNSRIILKNATPDIGTVYRVINIGAFTIYVKASALTDQIFAVGGLKNDKTEEFGIEVNGEYDFTYIAVNTWLVNAVNDSKLQPLEYTCQLYQAGTANITPQSRMIDTLTKNYDGGSRFIGVVFSRLGVGDYTCKVRYSGLSLDPTKLAVFFGDSTCRIYASSTGNDGANYKQWNFKTYTELGVVSDDILQGNNGTFINIKLYR